MIKELVLASMMSFGVGIGTMQHEPMQKVEPYTIIADNETLISYFEKLTYTDYDGENSWVSNKEFKISVIFYDTSIWVQTNILSDEYHPLQITYDDETNSYFIPYEDDAPNDWLYYNADQGEAYLWQNGVGQTEVIKTKIQNKDFYNFVVSQQMAQEGTMGEQIIANIKSGLGMIGDLASEFLVGFTALFWNTTLNELTVFGIFSLVMLGIAITMAVVKLCMNLIRSNTGV